MQIEIYCKGVRTTHLYIYFSCFKNADSKHVFPNDKRGIKENHCARRATEVCMAYVCVYNSSNLRPQLHNTRTLL